MKAILAKQPMLPARKPERVYGRTVCSTPVQATDTTHPHCRPYFEYFIKGTESLKPLYTIGKDQVRVSKDTDMETTEQDPAGEMREKTVIKDSFSKYCLDCAHPELTTPTPTPNP